MIGIQNWGRLERNGKEVREGVLIIEWEELSTARPRDMDIALVLERDHVHFGP